MRWHAELIDRLAEQPCAGYGRADSPATEPSTLAALALSAAGRLDAARQVAEWLVGFQAKDGSIGVRPTSAQPCWPTSLAVITWATLHETDPSRPYQSAIDRSVHWMISHQGVTLPPHQSRGHDGMLEAWPWVDETHAWVEPTALHILALKATGQGNHSRTRKAVRMLVNRQLSSGGWNYGNTIVLGRQLRPHVQPTGLALLALSGESLESKLLQRSFDYLNSQLDESTTNSSLSWSLLGLAAHQRRPVQADQWLEVAFRRAVRRDSSPHKLALLSLAYQAERAPLVAIPARHWDCDSPPAATSSSSLSG